MTENTDEHIYFHFSIYADLTVIYLTKQALHTTIV